MELLFVIAGIWGLLIALAPFGIWNAKARITDLEKKSNLLEATIKQLRADLREKKFTAEASTKKSVHTQTSALRASAPNLVQAALPAETPQAPPVVSQDVPKQPAASHSAPKDFESLARVDGLSSEPLLPPWMSQWFTGGRLFVTIGLLLLFIGAAMLFTYISQQIHIPIELRFVAIGFVGLALVASGHKMIPQRRDYALSLQGGGLGLWFLTIFSAFKFYQLLPAEIAFVILVAIGGATIFLSVIHNSTALAMLAVTGGFLAPILTSTGSGSHIALFSYYLLLNLVIFIIAWFKSWRGLNFVGFVFTFVIGLFWGGQYYVPEFYPSVQTFLIAYFLLYITMGVLFASRRSPNPYGGIDSSSIFGVPLIGFSLQMTLVHHFEYGIALSACALGLFYGLISISFRDSAHEGWLVLRRIYGGFSIIFFSLSIPYFFDAGTTASLWAAEGAGLIWLYARNPNRWYIRGGLALILIACCALLLNLHALGEGVLFFNAFYLQGMILVFASWFAARELEIMPPDKHVLDRATMLAFASIGLVGWFVFNLIEITRAHFSLQFIFDSSIIIVWLAFITVSSTVFHLLRDSIEVPLWEKPVHAVAFLSVTFAITQYIFTDAYHPLQGRAFTAWPLTCAVYFAWLGRDHASIRSSYHVCMSTLVVVLGGLEVAYQIDRFITNDTVFTDGYRYAGILLVTATALFLLTVKSNWLEWPVMRWQSAYQNVARILWLWCSVIIWLACIDQSIALLPTYIPVLNLCDLVLIAANVVYLISYLHISGAYAIGKWAHYIAGITVFSSFNSILLKVASYMLGLHYLEPNMFHSVEIQTTLTMVWTLLAMFLMVYASRVANRSLWFVGALLLGLVIAKLFLVDLAGVGTLSRIISFLGVGLLSVTLGYFSPLPPKESIERSALNRSDVTR